MRENQSLAEFKSQTARKRHRERNTSSDDDQDGYEVKDIVDVKEENGVKQYYMKWVGYEEMTWEPEDNLNCQSALPRVNQRARRQAWVCTHPQL